MSAGADLQLIESARVDPDLVVLEGFHALKHALRFGAEIIHLFAADPEAVIALAADLAPDLLDAFAARTRQTTDAAIRRAAPNTPTAVVGIARRPRPDLQALLASPSQRPVVLLEDPRNLGNVGAAVRVAAAADVAGLVTTGQADPWDPGALRGSAGLHFALPVGRIETLTTQRPVLGLTPGGDLLRPAQLPSDAVLAFGTERSGLTTQLLLRCDARVALPMKEGVSSLNLATAVAAVLFAWRLAADWRGR